MTSHELSEPGLGDERPSTADGAPVADVGLPAGLSRSDSELALPAMDDDTEFGQLSERASMSEVVTDILVDYSDRHPLSYDEEGLAALVEQARAGQEIEIPVVNGIWSQRYTPESHALRKSLDGGWAFSFEEWLWEHGQRVEGIPSEELRDPRSGQISNQAFISQLLQTGKAVELTKRQDDERGEVVVNNMWSLWRSYRAEGFLPFATVDIADADVGEISSWDQTLTRGPWHLRVPHPVSVGKKLVILPGLELPKVD